MNILYIHRTQGKGVEGVHISGIINALRKMGNEVDILAPIDKTKQEKISNKVTGISRIMPEVFFETLEIIYNFIAHKNVKKILRSKKVDFIYERFAFFSWIGVLISKKHNIPLFVEVNYTTYTPLVRKRTKIFLPLARYIERIVFAKAKGIFVVSSFLKEQLVSLGIDKNKIYLTVNAVDEQIFKQNYNVDEIVKKYNLAGKKVIGYVGGFYQWHRLDLLLTAIQVIERQRTDLCLLLIGKGPDRDLLKALHQQLNIQSELIMPGEVDHKDLPKYIKVMDICVLPDSNNYCSPVKIFEYMAMGKPVVAPELGNIRDIIVDRVNGILFKPKDAVELEKSLDILLSDKELYQKISLFAKEEIFNHHLWGNNAEIILAAFMKVVNNNAR